MAQTKEQKKKIIEDLKEKIDQQKTMVFIDFKGLKVSDLFELRKRLKKANCLLKVAKKTLLNLAFREKGIKVDLKELVGQIAVVFGFQEEIMPAKLVYQFSQENENLKILGGYFENEFKKTQEIITLAKLPTKEELFRKLVGAIRAPISNFLNVFQNILKGLIYVLAKARA